MEHLGVKQVPTEDTATTEKTVRKRTKARKPSGRRKKTAP